MYRRLITGVMLGGLVGIAAAQSSTGPLAVEDRSVTTGKEQNGAARGAPSDEAVMLLMQQLQQYEQEIQSLRGTVESLQHEIDTMKKAQRDRYLDLDSRINALAEASLNQAVEESGDEADSGAAASGDSGGDRKDYMSAREKLLNRDFQAARKGFRSYLDNHPDGGFRAFAHFWLGEVLRTLPDGDSGEAAKQFRTVIDEYPEHSKVPAALYKLASIQAEQGDVGRARVTLNKILLKYPDSSEARLAKTMLMQLEQEQGSS
jgi:tol-pal system protein YbgF